MKFELFKKPICKAPFTSMYFRPDGSVTPCCYNAEYIYGKYPEKSVKQIWEGKEIKMFRKAMLNHDLSQGCVICKRHIVNCDSEMAGIQQYVYLAIKKKPVKLELELSQKCNLNCIMCFQPKCNVDNNIYDDFFVNEISEYLRQVEFVHYIGGEPFINELYFQIWKKIVEINNKCINVVQTNGTIWNDRIKQLLEMGRFQLSVSIDSLDKDIYEQIRVNAKLDKTLNNINYFIKSMESNGDNLIINVCPMPINATKITDIIKYTSFNQSKIYFNTVFTPPHLSLISLPINELKGILHHYQIFLSEFKEISEQNKSSFNGLINQVKSLIKNWEIANKKISLNENYNEYLKMLIEKINPFVSEEEKNIIEIKLNSVFGSLLIGFPVVSGISLLLKNENIQFIIDIIIKNETEYISMFFTNYTLFFIR